MARFVKRFGHLAKETGASMVEYTLLIALIAAVAIASLTFLGQKADESVCKTGKAIASAGAAPDVDNCTPAEEAP